MDEMDVMDHAKKTKKGRVIAAMKGNVLTDSTNPALSKPSPKLG